MPRRTPLRRGAGKRDPRDSQSMRVKRLPCLACEQENVRQPFITESHHQNEGGHAGQARIGDHAQVPLCQWHHRSVLLPGVCLDDMTHRYGPSLANDPRQFRECYGSDEQQLLATQARLEREFPVYA